MAAERAFSPPLAQFKQEGPLCCQCPLTLLFQCILLLLPCLLQAIDDFHASMADVTSGLYTATSDIQTSVLDRMERWQQDWQPLADRLDVV